MNYQTFIRMHHLYMYSVLLKSSDISFGIDNPEWLKNLQRKLLRIIETYRKVFFPKGKLTCGNPRNIITSNLRYRRVDNNGNNEWRRFVFKVVYCSN